MPIEFYCPQCGSHLRVPISAAGKKAECPQCGAITAVPSRSTAGVSRGVPSQEPHSEEQVNIERGQTTVPGENVQEGAFSAGEGVGSGGHATMVGAPSAIPITPAMQSPYSGHPSPGYYPSALPSLEDTGMSVAALILGLFGLIAWCCPIIGFSVGLLALIFGIIGAGRGGRGMAVAGIVLSIVTLVLSTINAILGIMLQLAEEMPL